MSLNVLIAVEEAEVQSFLLNEFAQRGHTVTLARDGTQAWQKFQERKLPFDLILADVHMAGMDGTALMKHIRSACTDTPVAMISNRADQAQVLAALKLQAFDFLVRPVGMDQLESMFARLEILRSRDVAVRVSEIPGQYQEQLTLRFASRIDIIKLSVQRAIAHLKPYLNAFGVKSEAIALALTESVTNAVIHGNLEIPGHIKDEDWDKFHDLIDERQVLPQYASRLVTMRVDFERTGVSLRVSDEGTGFDHENLRTSDDPIAMVCGRGLTLIRYSMDRVSWEDGGRTIVMHKDFSAPDSAAVVN